MSNQGNNRDSTNYHVRLSPGSNANVKNTIFYFIFQLWLYLRASSMYKYMKQKTKQKFADFIFLWIFKALKKYKIFGDNFWTYINLPSSHKRYHTKFGVQSVQPFIGYRQTDKQTNTHPDSKVYI